MTDKQIEKNAKDYANEHQIYISEYDYCSYNSLVEAHINGAESRQVEIDKACELIKELVKLYHVNMPYYDNIVVWKAEQFLKEQNK